MKKLVYVASLFALCFMFSASRSLAQAPTITILPVSDTVCAGSVASFTAFSADTAVHYTWEVYSNIWDSVHNGPVYSGATTGTITFTATSTMNGYFYRVRAFNGAGISAYTPYVPLIVDTVRSAGVISGVSTFCPTAPTTFTTTGHDGLWSSANGIVSLNAATGVATLVGTSSGADTIIYNASNKCGIYLAVHPLNVLALTPHASISGAAGVCLSTTLSLSASVAGGAWSATNGIATVSASGLVTPISVGMDTIRYINATGCNTDTAWKAITVDVPISAGSVSGASAVCQGSAITLTTTGSGGAWSSSNSLATVSSNGVVSGVTPGLDTISYSGSNFCGLSTATHIVSVDTILPHATLSGPTSVCLLASISVAASVPGGVWSVTNGKAFISASGSATGLAAGTDTVVYTHVGGCNTDVASRVITIDTAINPGTISGAGAVCAGSWIHFTATMPGGFWLTNNGAIASADVSGNVTGHAHGTAVVSYLFSNSCGSFAATSSVTVNSMASVITGSDSVGVGASILLADSVSGGMWSSGDTLLAKVDTFTGVVHGISSGTVAITYTVSNACGISWSAKTISVGIPPAAAITGPDTVCAGSMITLSNPMSGTWSVTNDSGSITSAGVFTGIHGGALDTVNFTVTNAFGTSIASKVIYINRPPVIHVTTLPTYALGTAYTLAVTPPGGTWSTNAPSSQLYFISAATFVILVKDTFSLYYTATNTCGTTKDTVVILLTPDVNGIAQINGGSANMNIYPNPNMGSFSLNVATAGNDVAHIAITNMVGTLVEEMNIPTNKNANIDLTAPAGVYVVTATTKQGVYTSRILIAK